MKNILLLSTGGTISMENTERGLSPAFTGHDIANIMLEFSSDVKITVRDILSLDSSNIQPEEWRVIARHIYDALPASDGVIITHGTDTLAYTASAVSFMLRNLKKSVVFTGSQLPLNKPLTDAKTNLYTALTAVLNDIIGVTVAFDRKIIAGTRAVKVSTMGFNAFESVNAPYMGQIFSDGMRIKSYQTAPYDESAETALYDSLATDVFLLKLIPGTKPEIFDALLRSGYKGLVIEAFGSGGMHYLGRDLAEKISLLIKNGVPIVVVSQCLYEKTDLNTYAVGRRVLEAGVIPGMDMTTEAAVTKLMWALGQAGAKSPVKDVAEMFLTNIAGEVTIA